MDYALAFRYALDRRGGTVSLLLLTVCQFIPVLGPVVVLGYRAEVAEALAEDPDLRRHPRFTFDRFLDYLTRGVWPFAVGLILAVPVVPLAGGGFLAGLVLDPPGPNNPPVLAFGLGAAGYAVWLTSYLVLAVPATLHAELANRLDPAGALRFTARFWGLVGGRAVLTGLVFVPLSFAVMALGLLACVVGIYPAGTLTTMAAQHLVV